MSNEKRNEYGRWVPDEPLPGTFGPRWERAIGRRRSLGQGRIRAWIGGFRETRADLLRRGRRR